MALYNTIQFPTHQYRFLDELKRRDKAALTALYSVLFHKQGVIELNQFFVASCSIKFQTQVYCQRYLTTFNIKFEINFFLQFQNWCSLKRFFTVLPFTVPLHLLGFFHFPQIPGLCVK